MKVEKLRELLESCDADADIYFFGTEGEEIEIDEMWRGHGEPHISFKEIEQ